MTMTLQSISDQVLPSFSLLLAPDWMFHILMSLPSGFKLDFHLDLIENTTVQ